MGTGGRKPTKFDVELSRVEHRFEISRIIATGFTVALCIAATAVPLCFMKGIITPLAGKTTKVDINIALAVTVTLSVVVNLSLIHI